ncbi:universal stress protein [Oceanospirillum sp.]|uniref:universal stress protein n=1 Tax=Oceanospirillum sp. TaxID=2021254 RepID=UPI003A90EBD4
MFKKVLVPVDLGEPGFCQKAIDLALREVRDNQAELHLITVVPGYSNPIVAGYFSEDEHDQAVHRIAEQLQQFAHDKLPENLHPVMKVYEGSPAEHILSHIKHHDIDLVILAAHHRSRLDEFLLGSVSARVAERSHCSVMLIRN